MHISQDMQNRYYSPNCRKNTVKCGAFAAAVTLVLWFSIHLFANNKLGQPYMIQWMLIEFKPYICIRVSHRSTINKVNTSSKCMQTQES